MADKQKLRDMLDSLIDQNSDQAQVHFHSFLEDKMKEMLKPEQEVDVDDDSDTK